MTGVTQKIANNNAHKKLYEAQVKEHEKTHARLRTVEKENANLRGLLASGERRYQEAVKLLHRIEDQIAKDFPKEN